MRYQRSWLCSLIQYQWMNLHCPVCHHHNISNINIKISKITFTIHPHTSRRDRPFLPCSQHPRPTRESHFKKHFINVDNSEARTTYPRSACQSETSSHTVRCTRTQRRVRQQKEGPMNISTFTHNSHPAIRHTHFV